MERTARNGRQDWNHILVDPRVSLEHKVDLVYEIE